MDGKRGQKLRRGFSGRELQIFYQTKLVLGLFERSRQVLQFMEENFLVLSEDDGEKRGKLYSL